LAGQQTARPGLLGVLKIADFETVRQVPTDGVALALPAATARLPAAVYARRMVPSRTVQQVEADLLALRAAAERAGTALACLFSSADEFEAAVIKARREAGAFRRTRRGRSARVALVVLLLAAVFLML
jgi:hypothetical protein